MKKNYYWLSVEEKMNVLVVFCAFFIIVRSEKNKNCTDCREETEGSTSNEVGLEVNSHCNYPCKCPDPPRCSTGVALIRDGCGCCWQCARQQGHICDGNILCDASKDLACVYQKHSYAAGICRVMEKLKCSVNNQSFQDGETFLLDCRTQCTCKNGTYACVSLCPSESIHPSLFCKDPHLISVPGQCCREWRCKARPEEATANPCEPRAGKWSDCSAGECGVGLSFRWFLDSSNCQIKNESRLCHLRPCDYEPPNFDSKEISKHLPYRHHLRRSHSCRATQRYSTPVRLRVGECISDRKYRPKFCGLCNLFTCGVFSATTISVQFICPLHSVPEELRERKEDVTIDQTKKMINRDQTDETINVYEVMDEGQPIQREKKTRFLISQKTENKGTPNKSLMPMYIYSARGKKTYERDFFYSDEMKYLEIKGDNHETVSHKVQWIMRCHCSKTF